MAGPWEKFQAAEPAAAEGPWSKYAEAPAPAPAEVEPAPERSAGQRVARAVGNFGAGANERIASIAAAPFDLVNSGLRAVGVPIPEGSLAPTFQRGLEAFTVGEAPKAENAEERFARGAGKGVVDAASVLIPAARVAGAARAGSTTGKVAEVLASQPALQTAAGAIGSGTQEATDSALAGVGATLATALTPGALGALGRTATATGQRLAQAAGRADSEKAAARVITKALADDGITPQQAMERFRAWQADGAKPEALFDIGGENTRRLARTAAGRTGPGAERAVDFLADRQGNQAARIGDDVASHLGHDASDYHTTLRTLNETRQKAAEPLYEKAFGETLTPEQYAQVHRFVADPIGQEAMQRGLRVIELEHLAKGSKFDPAAYGVTRGKDGKWVAVDGEAPNMRTLDAVKRGFDDIVEGFRDPTSGRLNLDQYGRAVNDARAAYRNALTEISPGYREALASWSGPSQSMDALARGREIFKLRDGAAAEAVQSHLRTPADMDHFRLGVAQAIRDKVEGARDGADAVKRIFGSMKDRALLRSMFPNSASFHAFEGAMRREASMYRNGQFVSPRTGSQTAMREADAGDIGEAAARVTVAALGFSGQSPGTALRQIAINSMARARGLTPETADAVVRRLYTSDPAAIGAALDEAAKVAAKSPKPASMTAPLAGMGVANSLNAISEPPTPAENSINETNRIIRDHMSPGVLSATTAGLARGLVAGPESLAETARVATGDREARAGDQDLSPAGRLNAKPHSQVAWSEYAPWLAGKISEAVASSAPTVAAALAGAGIGSAAGPAGALAGGAAGGSLGAMAQTLGPAYQRALAEGKSPDDAVDDALKETGIAGIFGAAGGAVGAGLRGTIRKALLDVFGAQPALNVGQTAAENLATGRANSADELIEAGVVGAGTGLAYEAPGAVRSRRAGADAPFNETPPEGGAPARLSAPEVGAAAEAPAPRPAADGAAALPAPPRQDALSAPERRLALTDETGTVAGEGFTTRPTTPAERGAAEARDNARLAGQMAMEDTRRQLPAPEPVAALPAPEEQLRIGVDPGVGSGEGFTMAPSDRAPNQVRYQDALDLSRKVPGEQGPARRLALVVADVVGEPMSWIKVPPAAQVEVMRRLAERVPVKAPNPVTKPAPVTEGRPVADVAPEPPATFDDAMDDALLDTALRPGAVGRAAKAAAERLERAEAATLADAQRIIANGNRPSRADRIVTRRLDEELAAARAAYRDASGRLFREGPGSEMTERSNGTFAVDPRATMDNGRVIEGAAESTPASLPEIAAGLPEGLPLDFTQGRDRVVTIGDVSITYGVRPGGKHLTIDNIETEEAARGQGQARAALAQVLAEADARGMSSSLIAEPQDATTTTKGLNRFYRSMGFRKRGEEFFRPPGWKAPAGMKPAEPKPLASAPLSPVEDASDRRVADRARDAIREGDEAEGNPPPPGGGSGRARPGDGQGGPSADTNRASGVPESGGALPGPARAAGEDGGAGVAVAERPLVEHVTQKGKTLRGTIRTDLSRDQAKAIDPYTFRKDGGWFIREQHLTDAPAPDAVARAPEVPARDAAAEAAAAEAREVEKRSRQVNGLRLAAERLKADAEADENRDRNANTARRARMAAGATEDARKRILIADTMKNIADAIDRGEAPALAKVGSRAQVEALDGALRQGQYQRWRSTESGRQWDKVKDEPPTEADAATAKLPRVDLYVSMARDVMRDLGDKAPRGFAAEYKLIQHVADLSEHSDSRTIPVAMQPSVKAMLEAAQKKSAKKLYGAARVLESIAARDRFARMGIATDADLQAALTEYLAVRGGQRAESPIKRLERELVGNKGVGVDFFPTPPELVSRLVQEADIRPGMKALEPSAGKGDIAEAIKTAGADVDAVELSSTLRQLLDAKGIKTAGQDFDTFDAPAGGYDRVVMNPPFSRDAEHVQRAYDMLAPGGRLVAIVSAGLDFRQDKRAAGFRSWLAEHGGVSEPLPEGSFKSAFRPTGVATRLVVVDKPAAEKAAVEAAPEPQPEPVAEVAADAESVGTPYVQWIAERDRAIAAAARLQAEADTLRYQGQTPAIRRAIAAKEREAEAATGRAVLAERMLADLSEGREPTASIRYADPAMNRRVSTAEPKPPQSLLSRIREMGGLRDVGGELRSMDAHMMPGILNNSRDKGTGFAAGVPVDKAAIMLAAEGYLPEFSRAMDSAQAIEGLDRTPGQYLFDAIGRTLAGEPVYRERDADTYQAARDEHAEQMRVLDLLAGDLGINLDQMRGLSRGQVADLLAERQSLEHIYSTYADADAAYEAAARAAADAEQARVSGLGDSWQPDPETVYREGRPLSEDEAYGPEADAGKGRGEPSGGQAPVADGQGAGSGGARAGSGSAGGAADGRGNGDGAQSRASDLLGSAPRAPAFRAPEPTIRNDTRQAEIPGAEASARQAIASRQADTRGIRGSAPQQGTDDFGLFDSGLNQRPLFAEGGITTPATMARGGTPQAPRPPVTADDLTRNADATPQQKAKDARTIAHFLAMQGRYADGGITDALPPSRAYLSESEAIRHAKAPHAPEPMPWHERAARGTAKAAYDMVVPKNLTEAAMGIATLHPAGRLAKAALTAAFGGLVAADPSKAYASGGITDAAHDRGARQALAMWRAASDT